MSSPHTKVIRTISFQPDGVAIEYVAPAEDYRENGLMLNHVMFIPHDSDYEDEIGEALEAAQALLADALDDVDRMPAFDPRQLFTEDVVDNDDEEVVS
jgi:hypothetical protein